MFEFAARNQAGRGGGRSRGRGRSDGGAPRKREFDRHDASGRGYVVATQSHYEIALLILQFHKHQA